MIRKFDSEAVNVIALPCADIGQTGLKAPTPPHIVPLTPFLLPLSHSQFKISLIPSRLPAIFLFHHSFPASVEEE